eukprot:PhM_4_TR11330/c2_g1_i2/m.103930/K02155/ATPeV0C, ATP6L; V-type H+-transporting ATPase 16kDa proteolipid subunit
MSSNGTPKPQHYQLKNINTNNNNNNNPSTFVPIPSVSSSVSSSSNATTTTTTARRRTGTGSAGQTTPLGRSTSATQMSPPSPAPPLPATMLYSFRTTLRTMFFSSPLHSVLLIGLTMIIIFASTRSGGGNGFSGRGSDATTPPIPSIIGGVHPREEVLHQTNRQPKANVNKTPPKSKIITNSSSSPIRLSPVVSENGNPPQAILFGALGGSIAMAMSAVGSAIGISKAGVAATHLGLVEPSRMLRGMLPVVMSELLSIYGLIVGVVISLTVASAGESYTITAGYMHLASGCCVGFSGLSAGYAIGTIGDACCRTFQRTSLIFTAMVLMLVFAEAIGLYGLIGALVIHGHAKL